ncbi:MAG: hypothetical protein R2809_07965 [Flavobacteriales bacterium]
MKKLISHINPANTWKVLGLIFIVKTLIFIFFNAEFQDNWDKNMLSGNLAVTTGDTRSYYRASENFAEQGVYNSNCRMPGVTPIYAPLHWLFGADMAKDAIVILQLIISIISVLVLGKLAWKWTGSRVVFFLTIVLYTLSTFVSIWDHFLMADSFSTSFFIFSVYYLWKGLKNYNWYFVLLSGFFLAWAVFFRQILLVVYPIIALLILIENYRTWKTMIINGILFILPLIVSIGLWVNYQNRHLESSYFLVRPVNECYATYTPEFQGLSSFLIHLGYGEPFWEKGSVVKWMMVYNEKDAVPPISDRHFNSEMNLDSLKVLRDEYHLFQQEDNEVIKESIGTSLLDRIDRYETAYKSHNKLGYYLLNRLRLFRLFVVPLQVDNLPLPALHNMSFIEKATKLFYLVLFTLVALVGLLAVIQDMFFVKSNYRWWWLVPISVLVTLSLILGFVEQRYFVPIYPFLLIGLSIFVARFFKKFDHQ